MAEHKLLGILLAIGLCLVAGVFFLIDTEDTTTKDTMGMTVAVAPPVEQAGPANTNAKPAMGTPLPPGSPLAGKVLVSKQPVQVLSSPSPSASPLYSLPMGRPFRAVAKQGNYLRIQDVNSGAGGWIEEAALAPAPAQTRAVEATPDAPPPAQSTASTPRRTAPATPPKQTSSSSSGSSRSTASAPKQETKRRSGGLFSGNGPLKGLFGN
ncbi:hypothetical protein AUC68_14810 [Methyloceanibacter methanicus]|uniref:SH3b domain-containing protein n=1 Tax=Methyloceanibacter methanicus TaxID=1774968 RepID=A0A1E3W3Z6_9HYPH|nr:hypothetical protein [Methyloceanibacter methanicus]ODS00529.1 hypothetical protein AUC68_14810 [Methyloceanibacter methanicus]